MTGKWNWEFLKCWPSYAWQLPALGDTVSVWCLHSQTTLKSHTELLKLYSFVKSIFLLVFLLYMVLACKHVDTHVSKGQTISGVLTSQPYCLETERTPEQEADQQALRILPSLCMSRFFTWVLGILTQVLTLRLTLPSPFFIFISCNKKAEPNFYCFCQRGELKDWVL